ncbi:MAG: hypothetical protein ACLFOC_08025 [Campylobacterales bacterium]
MNIELIYPSALLVFVLYLLLKLLVRQKSEATYFSRVDILKKVFKKQSVLISYVEALVVLLLSLALSFPTTTMEKTYTSLISKEAIFLLNLKNKETKELALASIDKTEPSKVAISALLSSFHKIVPLTSDIISTKKIIKNLRVIDEEQPNIFSAMTASISLSHIKNTTLFLVGFDKEDIKDDVLKLKKFIPELKVEQIDSKESIKKLNPIEKISDITVTEKKPYFLYPLFGALCMLLLYIYLQNRIRRDA